VSVESTVRKIQLKLHLIPPEVAAEYIKWMHRMPESLDPNPMNGLLQKLKAEATERGGPFAAERAEEQVYVFVELYSLVLHSLLETARECIHLNTVTVVHTRHRRISCPFLFRRLIDQLNALVETEVALELIQSQYLRDRTMPQRLIDLLDVVKEDAVRSCQCVSVGEIGENGKVMEDEECQRKAASLVKGLVKVFQASAGRATCSAALKTVLHAEANLYKAIDDTILLNQLAREDAAQTASFSEREYKTPKRSKRGKEQRMR
jgi:hypothetical protein